MKTVVSRENCVENLDFWRTRLAEILLSDVPSQTVIVVENGTVLIEYNKLGAEIANELGADSNDVKPELCG